MSSPKPTLRSLLSETSRIITANSRHFSALSLLFLLPLSLSTTVFSLLFQTPSLHSHYRRFLPGVPTPDSDLPPAGNPSVLLVIIYILLELVFSLCALPPITHTAFHGYHGRPIKFVSALRSIPISFLPILATKLATTAILALIIFTSAVVMALPYVALALLVCNVDYTSKYLIVYVILAAVLLIGLVTYLEIQWYVVPAVVVVESRWGFAPLRRSSDLVKGMRRIVLLTILFFSALSGVMAIWYSNLKGNYGGNIKEGCGGWVVVQIAAYAGLSAALSLYGLVARTVLFVYCAEQLQIEGKIGSKLGVEYVPVPTDDVV